VPHSCIVIELNYVTVKFVMFSVIYLNVVIFVFEELIK
jgi:hypothetical protein